MENLETCKCYWLDEEFHPEENVTMPSTFIQCETCKTIQADELFINNLAKGAVK